MGIQQYKNDANQISSNIQHICEKWKENHSLYFCITSQTQ